MARTRSTLNTGESAGATGHITDHNALHTFYNAGGGGHLPLVAASNAPSFVKDRADWVCDGTGDQTEIQDALDTYGCCQLSPGSFSTSAVVNVTANQTLRGAGIDRTTITGNATSFHVIHMGNRQADGIMRNGMVLEDLSVSSAGGANSNDTIWCDGFGDGSYLRNVKASEGRYNLRITDADQSHFHNIKAFNARTAGIYCEVGLENTWGNVAFYSPSVSSSDNSAVAWLWSNNANQASPNRFDRVSVYGALLYCGTGLTGTVGTKMTVGASGMTWVGTLWENHLTQFQAVGQTQANFVGCTFIRNSGVSTDIFNLQTNTHHLNFAGCRFQQATNAFNGVSGSPQVSFNGINENQGNITNLFTGTFGWKTGTDTVFAGNSTLACGLDNQRFDFGFFNNVVANTQLRVGYAATATGPVGTVVKKIQVWDAAGTSLGFIPVYSTIT
jgi:hypothetical protein